jgi:predicted NAD/FAD-dependent oxidoreductase
VRRWSLDDPALLAQLLDDAAPWLDGARVEAAELHRWPWSGPVVPWPDRCCQPAPGVLLAGDAFGGPKVEGAYLSGRAAAGALAARAPDGAPG